MPDFIPILTAAILSLIILIIVFGGWIFYPGHVFKEGSRTILLGENFEVIYTIGEEVVANLEGRTSRDFFSGEDKRVEFNVDKYTDVSEATIRLKTLDSNYYGNLIIDLNGEEVYRGAPLGDKMITFDPAILERGNFLVWMLFTRARKHKLLSLSCRMKRLLMLSMQGFLFLEKEKELDI